MVRQPKRMSLKRMTSKRMSQLWRGEMLIHLPIEKTEPGTGITQGFGEGIGHKDGLDGKGGISDLLAHHSR